MIPLDTNNLNFFMFSETTLGSSCLSVGQSYTGNLQKVSDWHCKTSVCKILVIFRALLKQFHSLCSRQISVSSSVNFKSLDGETLYCCLANQL